MSTLTAQRCALPASSRRSVSKRAVRVACKAAASETADDTWSPSVAPMGTGEMSSNAVSSGSKSFGSALVRFGFPKGSLQNATEQLFARAGVPVKVEERNYFPSIQDDELSLVLFRSQEISRYVADGILDAGICGADWIVENGSEVVEVAELKYSKATAKPAKWVIAVPEDSPVREVADLEGTLIASELVNTTTKFFEDRGVRGVQVEYSWGATEVKASLPGVGAIVDITETGSSLIANKLRIVDVILRSTTRLVANKDAWANPQKRAKIENLAVLLNGAIEGKKKVGLKMNLPTSAVPALSSALPAEKSPTVSPLLNEAFCAVEVVVDENAVKDLVPLVRALGGTGIVTYPINLAIHS